MTKKIAFVFPGQGSQSVGMLAALAAKYQIVEHTFSQASEILGYDLWDICQQGSEATLNKTEITQPALLAADYSIWQIWKEKRGVLPSLLAGHSLGEYSALVCAQALDFATGIKIVAARGRFMQAAVPENTGAMAAIVGLSDEDVQHLCDKASAGEVVSPANYNSLGQVVIGGQKAAVLRAMKLAEEAGAKLVMQLPMSVPSHCSLMQPAAEEMKKLLTAITFKKPLIPVINNVDVCILEDPELIKDALVRQLSKPVRWVETIQSMQKMGIEIIVECGPGRVLAGLIKRITKGIPALVTTDDENLERTLAQIG